MPKTIQFMSPGGELWEATILPEHGGHCVRLTVTVHERGTPSIRRTYPVLEEVSLEQVCQQPSSYGTPILFPFAGRIAHATFRWQGHWYPVAPPHRHGLVRQRPWQVVDAGDHYCCCQVTVTPERGAEHFPFHFNLLVVYQLTQSGLTISGSATNLGREFPYTFGLHPYFHAAPPCFARVPARRRWQLDCDLIPTGRPRRVSGRYDLRVGQHIAAERYDDVYTRLDGNPQSLCRLRQGSGETQVSFWREDYPTVVVYTPPQRAAVCLEPYTGAPDAFNHPDDRRFGLRVLPAGATVAFGSITIGFHPQR